MEHPMFAPDTPMTLTNVTFTTEEIDKEIHRVVVCTLLLAPFTPEQADALYVKKLLFDKNGHPLKEIETIVLNIEMPPQQLTFAMAPDQTERRIVMHDVTIEEKLRAKVKHDRDPVALEAVLKISFRYPTADELLYIANGVNDVHFLTFEDQQLSLPMKDGEQLRPGVYAEH